MIKRSALILLGCFSLGLFIILPVFASNEISLEQALSKAAAVNPELLAAKRSYESAEARIWQAASPGDPMLEFEYDKMTADRMLTGDPMKTYAISQDIPFPTKLYLRAKIAARAAKISYQNYRAKELEIISKVKAAYAELFFVYKSTDINKENKTILEQIAQTATTRYSSGKGSQAEVLKAQVELASTEAELILLEQKRATAQARLNILLDQYPDDDIGIPLSSSAIRPVQSLDESYALAEKNNPELAAYRYAIEKGKAAYDLSLNEFMPDISIKFKQMINKDRMDGKAWAGMLGVTVPVWFFSKQAFGVKEMKSELEMLKAEFSAKEKMVRFDVRDAYARVDANQKLVQLYETSFLPQADETFTAAIKAYESEKTDFLTLLDTRRLVADIKLKHYNAVLDLMVALADLERITGRDPGALDKKEVNNEKK